MTIIAEKDRATVRDVLVRDLVDDVELLLFTRERSQVAGPGDQECQTCDDTRELLDQIVNLSDRVHLTVHDVGVDPDTAIRYNVNAVPTVIIRKRAPGNTDQNGRQAWSIDADITTTDAESGAAAPVMGANLRFLGLPGGYEFSTLIADIVDVSRGRTDLSADTVAAVRAITAPVHIQVFVTPGCPNCPPVARMAHQLAMQNPLIVADVIEANEFQELSERYRVRSVPKTVINNRIEFVGSLPEAKVLEAVQQAVKRDG